MSNRTRPSERQTEFDWDEPSTRRRRRPPSGPSMRRFGLPVVGGALLVGLLVGYVANSGGGGTTTVTHTRTVTAPATAAAPSGTASRATISVAILNGSGERGLAGRRADEARAIGYTKVAQGNTPSRESADRVLYRAGAQAEARQVATDLGLPTTVQPAAGDPAAAAAASTDRVIVVLGPSGASGSAGGAGGATTPAPATGGATGTGTGTGTGQ